MHEMQPVVNRIRPADIVPMFPLQPIRALWTVEVEVPVQVIQERVIQQLQIEIREVQVEVPVERIVEVPVERIVEANTPPVIVKLYESPIQMACSETHHFEVRTTTIPG
ncbi:hypothetical protein CGRA01v4_14471 [Colletotrichum graminicola]|uniref:Uncharacterized protein n=1 Tax=Colletotrichum graminicola (strain M1.001 / M2 / FGSC 10212) TaxID=645133 RepID=E3Q4M5_COLGM|nr:uncharacterized protein GLRG_01184 [Colletotrichum graminicola M1.001]EFQ26040.1 hypothetical protein GLRG_01184 [Colletotrichum graminicola M1.001]WDK23179.1 hypothetical protein CGRA01v4_14471 [Colletotrichum graminicola]